MDLLEMALKTVEEEQRANPISKQEYQKEARQSIRRFEGKPIFSAYRVLE